MKKDDTLSQSDSHNFMVDSIIDGLTKLQRQQLLRTMLDSKLPQQLEKIAMEYNLI